MEFLIEDILLWACYEKNSEYYDVRGRCNEHLASLGTKNVLS